jgi:Phage portal protein
VAIGASLSRFARTAGGTLGRPSPPTPQATVAAGRVLTTRGGAGRIATPPPAYGLGPPLEGFTFDGYAPPWFDRELAMTLPTISRCRTLIVSAVSALPFTFWTVDTTQIPTVERRISPPSWHARPDPDVTRQWLLAWTVDDLMFYELAHWEITSRYAPSSGGFPATFRRIPPGCLQVDNAGVVTIDDDYGKRQVAASEIVVFRSPIDGLLTHGYRAISTALQLDTAADRFAAMEVPAGVLEEQDGGEDLAADELTEMAEQFAAARQVNAIAATNKYVRYREIPTTADAMQLVEGRTYQALELSRLGNTPPYLVGAPAGTGMTYQNGQQARQDLIDFGAGPYIGCIEQTLSGPRVTPRNQAVRLDQNAWLRNPFTTPDQATPSPNDMQLTDPAAAVPV